MVNVFKHVDDRFIVVKGDYHDDILPFTIWLNDTNDLIQPGDDIENVINVLPTTYYIINNEPTNSVVYVDSKVLDDLDAYIDETEGTEGDPFEVNTKRVLREIYEQGRRIIGFDEN